MANPSLCGYCKLELNAHPILHCLYTYVPILDGIGKLVGYEMIDSPIRAIHDRTDQPTP